MTYSQHAKYDHKLRQQYMKTLGQGKLLYATVTQLPNTTEPRTYEYYDNGIMVVLNDQHTKVITRMIPNPSRLQALYENLDTTVLESAKNINRKWKKYYNKSVKEWRKK